MSLTNVTDWMNEFSGTGALWYVKRLSANDTQANGSHQAGTYIPKQVCFQKFPQLNNQEVKNPSVFFDLFVDSHSQHCHARAVYYNDKYHGGGRNETRFTRLGGGASPLLDPESTGALVVFALVLAENSNSLECHVWVCRSGLEEDVIEERVGPVEPGRFGWRLWTADQELQSRFGSRLQRRRQSCALDEADLPSAWLKSFPSTTEILEKSIQLRPGHELDPDSRLIKRRQCETEIFFSVEEALELHDLRCGFESVQAFVDRAQTILQRRKARAGRSLELQTRQIFLDENLEEDKHFAWQPLSEEFKRPDFLFPSETAYRDMAFPSNRLRMLAVKTSCRDRWRQILNEADRISDKHLLTIQHGVSEKQFAEMSAAKVRLVVPESLHHYFPKTVRPELQTLESFIADIRLLTMSD